MKPEAAIRRRLRALHTLGEAVGALKILSAHHFREARKAVEPARIYREGVERMLGSSGVLMPAGERGAALLIIGAELGLCGSYNVQIVQAGADHRRALGDGPTFCVGHRAATLLRRRGLALARTYAAPTSVDGITGLLLELAEDVLTSYANERLASFDIVSTRFGGVGSTQVARVRLLPLAVTPRADAQPPRYIRADSYRNAVLRETLYITLYDLLLDAIASEHGARLLATQSAERWLEERAARLRRHLSASRQEASTQEMIEVASGARLRTIDADVTSAFPGT